MLIKKENKKYFFFYFSVFLLLSFFSLSSKSFAATIHLNPANGLYKVGDTIQLTLSIRSNISVNAVAAKISYPKNLLTLSSISKENSVVSLWAQQPLYSNLEGLASLEGVILYGYTGDRGNIVTFIFKAREVGVAEVKINTASILANDGNGTETLSGKYNSTLTILKSEGQSEVVAPKEATGSSVISIKEISAEDNYSLNKFLISADRSVKDQLYSIQIDSLTPIMWVDDGSHIFETPLLSEGKHTIRIIASDNNLNLLSGQLDFSTKILKIPVITHYPKKVKVGEPIIIRGLADPYINVEFVSTNKETQEVNIGYAQTNVEGKFTYLPENENQAGTYSINARAIAKNKVSSNYMNPIEIVVKEKLWKFLTLELARIFRALLPYLILIIIFILLILYAIYRIKKYQIYLKRKLREKEEIFDQQFKELEKETSNQVRDDVERAEKSVQKEMADLEKDVDNL